LSALLTGFALVFIGLAGGLVVGSGMVAFLVVLNIIPRLAQITNSYSKIRFYERAVVLGSVFFTWTDMFDWNYRFFPLAAAFVGLLAGAFVGMLAAALTEVINVLPILAKRVRLDTYIMWLLMAMILGKVFGSIADWLGWLGP